MKDLETRINELKAIVAQSGNGHLPLPCRVELLQSVGSTEIVNKVFVECCKKVYPLWDNEIEDTLLRGLLCSADEYLYHGKGKADALVKDADNLRNYVEEQCCAEGLAGWAVIMLCYSTADCAAAMVDIDEYEGEDDGAFDYEVWNTDFFASMAFSGGNPFVGEGDAGKRREFWNWYLDTVEALCRKADAPLIRLDAPKKQEEQNAIPQRTQTYRTPIIQEKIRQVIENSLKVYAKYCTGKWDKIIVEAWCIHGILTDGYYMQGNSRLKMPVSLTASDLMTEIKDEMYSQCKSEGAWLVCSLEISTDLTYTIHFNYDEQLTGENKGVPEDFLVEFKDYPRPKEYTPMWWQKILGKKAKYLKSTVTLEQVAIPQRTQTHQVPLIQEKIRQVIENSLKVYAKYCTGKWDKIIVEAWCVCDIRTDGYYMQGDSTLEMPVSLMASDLMVEIKEEMYRQCKSEGAWLVCSLEISPALTYTIHFNYDEQLTGENKRTPDYYFDEFEEYPRSKEYTPIWWQKILGKKAEYLK